MVASKSGWQLPKCYLSCRLEQAASSVASASAKSPLTDSMHRWRQGGVARVRSSDSQRKNHRGQGRGGTRTDTRGHTRARTGTHATTGTNEHAANTPPQPTQKNVDQQCTQQGRSGAKDAAHGTKHAQGATAQIHRTLGIHTITENPQKKITGFHPKNLFKFACKIFPAAAPPPSSTSRKTTTRRSSLRHLAKKGDNIGRHGVSLASSPPSLCWELVQCAGETCDRDHLCEGRTRCTPECG